MTPPPHRSKIVCECLKVTEAQVVKAIREKRLRTLKEVTACTSAGEGCNACHPLLRDYLDKEKRRAATSPPRPPAAPRDSSQALSL